MAISCKKQTEESNLNKVTTDLTKTSRSYIKELSKARCDLAGTSVGNTAFFAGGYNENFRDELDIYNIDKNTLEKTHLSQARSRLAATSVGSKAMFAGGIQLVLLLEI